MVDFERLVDFIIYMRTAGKAKGKPYLADGHWKPYYV